jgi:hypothetical protein
MFRSYLIIDSVIDITFSDPINPNLSNLAEKEILDRTEQKKLELIHSAEAEYHKTSLETFKIQNGSYKYPTLKYKIYFI